VNRIVNLIGILGVIGSLIFVGMELRQSQRVALAAQQQARTSAIIDIIASFSEANSPASWASFVAAQDFQLHTGDNRELGENATYQLWMLYENDYLQYELGLMDEDIWQAKLSAMQYLYSKCTFKEVNDLALSFSSSVLSDLVAEQNRERCVD
jgi:hypothetical protein